MTGMRAAIGFTTLHLAAMLLRNSTSAAVACAVLAGAATADPAATASASQPQAGHHPRWVRTPSPDEFSWAYPPEAARSGIGGRATMACQVTAQGTLSPCRVVAEDPPGRGFGEAALKLAPYFRMAGANESNTPATIYIPVQFAPRR